MSKLTKRLGKVKRKELIKDYVNIYNEYEAKAKSINPNSILMFHSTNKDVIFYVEIDDPTEYEKII